MSTALWPAKILVMNINSTNLSCESAVETDTAVIKSLFWPASFVYLPYVIPVWWWWNSFHVKTIYRKQRKLSKLGIKKKNKKTLSTAATTQNILRLNQQNSTNTHHRSGKIPHRFYINEVFEKQEKNKCRPLFPALGYFFFWGAVHRRSLKCCWRSTSISSAPYVRCIVGRVCPSTAHSSIIQYAHWHFGACLILELGPRQCTAAARH